MGAGSPIPNPYEAQPGGPDASYQAPMSVSEKLWSNLKQFAWERASGLDPEGISGRGAIIGPMSAPGIISAARVLDPRSFSALERTPSFVNMRWDPGMHMDYPGETSLHLNWDPNLIDIRLNPGYKTMLEALTEGNPKELALYHQVDPKTYRAWAPTLNHELLHARMYTPEWMGVRPGFNWRGGVTPDTTGFPGYPIRMDPSGQMTRSGSAWTGMMEPEGLANPYLKSYAGERQALGENRMKATDEALIDALAARQLREAGRLPSRTNEMGREVERLRGKGR